MGVGHREVGVSTLGHSPSIGPFDITPETVNDEAVPRSSIQ
jgi:hypothetical protein